MDRHQVSVRTRIGYRGLLGLILFFWMTATLALPTVQLSAVSSSTTVVPLNTAVTFSVDVTASQSFSGSVQFSLRNKATNQATMIASNIVNLVGARTIRSSATYRYTTALPNGVYQLRVEVYHNNPWTRLNGYDEARTITVSGGRLTVSTSGTSPSPVTPVPTVALAQPYAFQWSDEFSKDLSLWNDHDFYRTAPGWADNDNAIWFPIPSTATAQVSGGLLYLKNRPCPNPVNAPMCGADLNTAGKFQSFVHGRVEVRAKIPANADGFAAFWLLGNGTGTNAWPRTGEIDIFEFVNNGSAGGTPFFTVHWYAASCPWGHCQKTFEWPATLPNFSNDFHVWSLTRTTNKLEVHIDGKLWSTITRAELANIGGNYDVIFNEPMHLRADLSSGGVWANDPARAAQPGDFLLDYVRVWKTP